MSCEGCPYITMLELKKQDYEKEVLELNKESVEFELGVVGLEHKYAVGNEVGVEYPESTKPTLKNAREAINELVDSNDEGIKLRNEAISAIDSDIEFSRKTCLSKGPIIKKRFGIFGRHVIKCGSLSAQKYYFDIPTEEV